MKQYVDYRDVAYNFLLSLEPHPDRKEEINNLIDFVLGNITFKEYFKRQDKIISEYVNDEMKCSWKELKKFSKETYEHERAHANIWKSYGIEAQLYRVNNDFFVLENLTSKDITNNAINAQKYKQMLKEALFAPFITKEEIAFNDILDITSFEVLSGNIKQLNQEELANAFSKYKWYRNVKK